MLHFFEERTVIPLKDIASYELKWYLHEPIFARKYWFLELTVRLKNDDEQLGSVASVKFNYLSDNSELRQHIAAKITRAIDAALLRTKARTEYELSLTTRRKPGPAVQVAKDSAMNFIIPNMLLRDRASEHEQRDPAHLNPELSRHQRVRELVEHNRRK